MTSVDGSPGRPRRRRVLWGVLGVLVVLVVVGLWMGLGAKRAASVIQTQASAAQTSIETAKTKLEAGDYAGAHAAAAQADAQVAEAAAAAGSAPGRALGQLPVAGQAVADLDHLIAAASGLSHATGQIVDVYGAATGKSAGSAAVFRGGKVNFTALSTVSTTVDEAIAEIGAARASLEAVQGPLPGTHSLAAARDSVLAKLDPLQSTLTSMKTVLTAMPSALGQKGTKSYLLVTLNPAELYPGGGAALSAAVIKFDHGAMSVPVKGSVSDKLFYGNPRVVWEHMLNKPYYAEGQGAAFAFSDLYPDFSATAIDIERSWVANGMAPVDGVVALDPIALQAALRVIGPVGSAGYGQITADNLIQKTLVDAYADYAGDQSARHRVNEALVNAVFARLTGGSGALGVVKALASTAPGHHFRVHLDDATLQKLVDTNGLGGAFPQGKGDLLAVFTENQNGSKVDIFQKRKVRRVVDVKADGSATVVTSLSVTNAVPPSGRNNTDRTYYLTTWSKANYLEHAPAGAQELTASAPMHDPEDVNDPTVYPDLDGRSIVRALRWTSAGATTTVTFRYTLPAGTFGTGGHLHYTLNAVPQPLVKDASLSLVVKGPGAANVVGASNGWTVTGGTAAWSGSFSQVLAYDVTWK